MKHCMRLLCSEIGTCSKKPCECSKFDSKNPCDCCYNKCKNKRGEDGADKE